MLFCLSYASTSSASPLPSHTQVVLQLKDINTQLDALLTKLNGRSVAISASIASHGGAGGVGGGSGGVGEDVGAGLLSPLASIPPGSAMGGGLLGSLSFRASAPLPNGEDVSRRAFASEIGSIGGGGGMTNGTSTAGISGGSSLLGGDASAMVAATLVNRALEDAKLSIERWRESALMDLVSAPADSSSRVVSSLYS